ncbi:MAG: aldehyde dehydrogenase [Alistipes sp.]|nr:aldehyde dehydrogenase [Alistipes sp.]
MAVENSSTEYISQAIESQREYFRSGATLDVKFRKEMLQRLLDALHKWEKPLAEALWHDLHKSYEEAYMTEFGILYGELKNHLKHLSSWAAPKKVGAPLRIFPSRSKIVSEPLGNTLIIAPWNYPVQLLINPLIGAISAGCTAILKPSPYVPNVAHVLEQMIDDTFDDNYIAIIQGNRDINRYLLEQRFDLIFFTGSPMLGREVMTAAAKHLTPVVLELGGKSPCIVDKEANIKVAAKRIAWGKSLNAGQTCIAPDYLLVHEDIKEEFVEALHKAFRSLLGRKPQKTKHFVRIVSDKAFDRLVGYLDNGAIRFGGGYDREERFIEPTLLENVSPSAPVMQEEIFGPIFPLLTFSDTEDAIKFVTEREKPLALYYFGSTEKGEEVLHRTSSGGACLNDVIMHIANENTPFGGVGNSGMGSYHGEESFHTFSHRKSVLSTTTRWDIPFRYMPYRLFSLIKRLM